MTAILARLEMEGKLASSVSGKSGLFSRPELQLRLLVPAEQLAGYERKLVDGLFFGAEETSTERVRQHYKRSGFNPVGKIAGVATEAAKLGGRKGKPEKPPRWPALALLGAAALLLAIGMASSSVDLVVAAVTVGLGLFLYLWALGGAYAWRDRVYRVGVGSLTWAIPLGLVVAAALTEMLETGPAADGSPRSPGTRCSRSPPP